jgi:hypothetical protein
MRSIELAVRELERAFGGLAPLFGRVFPQPVIAIQSRGRRQALGWFCADKWQNVADGDVAEITITAEHLQRPVEEIGEVVVHEMCHYANALDGIKDCTVNQYHNKRFKARAESVGLIVTRGPRGYAYTSLGDDLRKTVQALDLDPEAFSLFRKPPGQKKAPTKMKKWRCDCTIIRAATEVQAVCTACGKPFRQG